jgi:hypothetical protein
MGIAISHFDLIVNEKNIPHRWIVSKPEFDLDELTEYTASCEIL